MVAQPHKSDIRSFFPASNRAPKRLSNEGHDYPRGRSKSPRLDPGPSSRFQPRKSSLGKPEIADEEPAGQTDSEDETSASAPAKTEIVVSSDHMKSSFGTASNASQVYSSQRVVRNGEVVVTNSDDEPVSDDEPADLAILLGLSQGEEKKVAIVESQSPNRLRSSTDRAGRALLGLKRHFKTDTSFKARRLIQDFASTTTKERQTVEAVQKALKSISETDSRIEKLRDLANMNTSVDLDPSMVASMMGNNADNEGVERLIQAVKRTDALQSKAIWSFLGDYTPDLTMPRQAPKTLMKLFGKSSAIEDALVNGFIGRLATSGNLVVDEETLEWSLCAALSSPRDDLIPTYCDLLLHAGPEHQMDGDWIWRLFLLMGASGEALDQQDAVQPRIKISESEEKETRDWSRILRILQILERCAVHMPLTSRHDAVLYLCRLALDAEVSVNHHTNVQLRQSLDALLEAIPIEEFSDELDKLTETIARQIVDIRLRVHLLRQLVSTSPRALELRHLLASEFFFADYDESEHEDEYELDYLRRQLKRRSEFEISPGTNFTQLAGITEILDVYIDDGRVGLVLDDEDAAKGFDQIVDKLADHIRSIGAAIKDSGANYLARTEAKESLDALHARLLFAVRTKPRTRKSIFGPSVGSTSYQQTLSESLSKKLSSNSVEKSKIAETAEPSKSANDEK